MGRRETRATAPARLRKGLPVIADGSRALPFLITLDSDAACNNGCDPCLTQGTDNRASITGQHVVIRDREPTLHGDLPTRIAELKSREPATLTLLTNGRLLVYPKRARALKEAGLDRVIVKLFGSDSASHDAHTQVVGSFEQACAGIANARAVGLETHVTFPLDRDDALATQLTGLPAVVFPEPQVQAHAGEYRVDLVALREGADDLFARWFFPMAHVQTGPRCNLRCVYCNVHGGDDPRLFEAPYIESLVELAAKQIDRSRGRATLDFIGGEPTLHPDLPALIRHARSAGFDEVSICTNGVLLHKRPGLLDELVAAGLTMIRYSFHSHDTGQANALADVRGLDESYVQLAKRLLARTDIHTHFYRILLAETVDTLPNYLRFLSANNQTGKPIDLSLGMPSMRGRLFDNPDLVPDLDQVREAAREAIQLSAELGIELFLHHTPACLVPEAPERHSCLNVTTLQVESDSSEALSFEGDARYVDACDGCGAKKRGCHGVPAAYFDAGQAVDAWVQPIDPDVGEVEYVRRADV